MLHYSGMIRMAGPLVQMDMRRFEAKHKVFKVFRNATNNFKSINKTLALKHQENICHQEFSYKDILKHGKIDIYTKSNSLISEKFNENEPIFETKFVKFNEYNYKAGLIIVFNSSLHEIKKIFYVKNEFFFLTSAVIVVGFNEFFNSFEIQKSFVESSQIIKFDELKLFKSHEVKQIKNEMFIISDSLELKKNLNWEKK